MRPRLVIFAKAPLLGRAKTRLAADIGIVHAKRIYRSMTSRILRSVTDPRWDTVLAVTPSNMLGRVPDWHGAAQIPQAEGSLSPRLAKVFAEHKGPLVVIGTDSPQVTRRDIARAFKALKTQAAVFGPADDGGFWLMGMNAPVSDAVFDNVRWSSAQTLSDIESRLDGSVAHLQTLMDVDTLSALKQLRVDFPRLI